MPGYLTILLGLWLMSSSTVAENETEITAFVTQDTFWTDRAYRYRVNGITQELEVAQGGGGQWAPHGGEYVIGMIFEPEKFQGILSDEVRSATLRMELSFHRADSDMGYDIIAFQNESWDELAASWNARESFLVSPNPIEMEDWLSDNDSDDDVQVNLGTTVYATMDDIGEHYGDKAIGLGLIKEWDLTDLVKAWVDGRETAEYGLAIRNRLDANCPQCPEDTQGTRRRFMETHFWSKDATRNPFSGQTWGPFPFWPVKNNDPWPPIVPQIVIELGSAATVGDLTGFVGGELDGMPDGEVNTYDIDYAFEQFNSVEPDDRADLNEDNEINDTDIEELLDILSITYGDTNGNGHVDLVDFNLLALSFGGPGFWANGDFNGDRQVSIVDFNFLALNYNQSPATATVPEPATFGLLINACVLAGWRRR